MAGTFVTDFDADELHAAEKSLQNFVFVQLDDDPSVPLTSWLKPLHDNQNVGYKLELFVGLQQIPQHIYRFHNISDCFTCLRSISNHAVILIISRSEPLDNEVKSTLVAIPHVLSIYQFGCVVPWQKLWGNVGENVLVFPMTRTSIKKLEQPNELFVMNQLLSELLLRVPRTSQGKSDFFVFCLNTFGKNQKLVNEIHQFDRTYESDQAIWWYTRNVFIYRLLGRMCDSGNPNLMFKIRFYVADLFEQMKMLHQRQMSAFLANDFLHVYRGKLMPKQDLEYFVKNKSKLLVLRRFLSTVTRQEVALIYSGDGHVWKTDYVSVLFDIKVDMKANISKSIAWIEEYSSMPDENEILLPMGMMFRIDSIRQVKEKLWEINLVESVQQESFDNHHFRKQPDEANGFISMDDLLQDIHETQHGSKYIEHIPTRVEPPNQPTPDRFPTKKHHHEEVKTTTSGRQKQTDTTKNPLRNTRIIRFLYEAGQFSSNDEHPPLDLSTEELHDINLSLSAIRSKMESISLANVYLNNAT